MLDANNNNSWGIIESSSIKSYKLSEIPDSSLSFKFVMIVTFKTSKNNECEIGSTHKHLRLKTKHQ